MMSRKVVCLMNVVLMLVLVSNASAALVGHWEFDETSGDIAYDSSGNNYDGTVSTGAAWVIDPERGNVLDFAGAGHVTLPPAVLSTVSSELTIAFWQNCSASAWGIRNPVIYGYIFNWI